MRYGVQQTDFLSFWTIFCPFMPPLPPNNLENQTFEKMEKKNHLEISFYICAR